MLTSEDWICSLQTRFLMREKQKWGGGEKKHCLDHFILVSFALQRNILFIWKSVNVKHNPLGKD